MRRIVPFVLISLLAIAGVAPAPASSARAGDYDPMTDYSTDDLLVRFGGWDGCEGWFQANQREFLSDSRRATPVAAGAVRKEDAAARGRARDALLKLLDSRDVFVASEAALALGLAGDARDIATLAKLVRGGTSPRRVLRWAALGLGEMPMGDAAQADDARAALFSALEIAYEREDHFVPFWTYCACALGMRGDSAAVPHLVELRKKMSANQPGHHYTHGEVLGAICQALGTLGSDIVVPELEDTISWRSPPREPKAGEPWTAAISALQRVGGVKAVPVLRDAARDRRDQVRAVALQALGLAAGPADDETAELLSKALLTDRDNGSRQMAAIGLARAGHKTANATLAKAMRQASAIDRPYLAVAIGIRLRSGPDPKLSEELLKALSKTGNPEERAALIVGCALGGLQEAKKEILSEIPRNRQGVVAASGAFALGLLGATPDERKVLRETVDQSVDETARLQGAVALGRLRDHAVVDDLRKVLESKRSDRDRGSAAMCLGHVGDDADIDVLVELIENRRTSDPLRACAVHGLGRLLDRREGARLARVVANSRWVHSTGGVDPLVDLRALVE